MLASFMILLSYNNEFLTEIWKPLLSKATTKSEMVLALTQENTSGFVEILQLWAKFQTSMVSWSRFIWITNFSDDRRVWTANLLHAKSLLNQRLCMQEIRSLNPPAVAGICDPNRSRARHFRFYFNATRKTLGFSKK